MGTSKSVVKISTEQLVEDCLRDFLGADAALGAATGIYKSPLRPVVDSIVIVEAIVEVEAIINCKLPLSIIRQGGYYSIDDAVTNLLPKIMEFSS
jgi:hypothetical protein